MRDIEQIHPDGERAKVEIYGLDFEGHSRLLDDSWQLLEGVMEEGDPDKFEAYSREVAGVVLNYWRAKFNQFVVELGLDPHEVELTELIGKKLERKGEVLEFGHPTNAGGIELHRKVSQGEDSIRLYRHTRSGTNELSDDYSIASEIGPYPSPNIFIRPLAYSMQVNHGALWTFDRNQSFVNPATGVTATQRRSLGVR